MNTEIKEVSLNEQKDLLENINPRETNVIVNHGSNDIYIIFQNICHKLTYVLMFKDGGGVGAVQSAQCQQSGIKIANEMGYFGPMKLLAVNATSAMQVLLIC